MQNWVYITLMILGIYVLLSVLLYYLQDYFLFKPEKLPKDFQFYYDNQEIEEHNFETLMELRSMVFDLNPKTLKEWSSI